MRIIMLGAPGAGKGTQAEVIAEKFCIPHISTGDIFRKNIKEGTELGVKAKEYIDKGQLVPDELTTDLIASRVSEEDCKNGYILDGFPRTIPQAEFFDKALEKSGGKIDLVIDIEVPDDVIVSRLSGRRVCKKCGALYHMLWQKPKTDGVCDSCGGEVVLRADDAPETVLHRLEVYHKETQPLIDYYSQKGSLKAVDGTVSYDEVWGQIVKLLEVL